MTFAQFACTFFGFLAGSIVTSLVNMALKKWDKYKDDF